ncbi:MAG TPA: hypothetical protein VGL71_11160, partial [Urbifossiella sp.]
MRFSPRRAGATTLATLAAFAGAFVLVHVLAPNWAHAAGLDVWDIVRLREEMQRERGRQRELGDQMEQLDSQTSASDAVADSLIEERITFSRAVAEMERITRDRPEFAQWLVFVHSDCKTHRDRIARYALGKVRVRLENDAARQEAVMQRLDSEYASLADW